MSAPFDGIACFASGLSAEARFKRAQWLQKACWIAPEARPAIDPLGRLSEPQKVEEARRILNSMPSLPTRHVLAAYLRESRGRG